MDNSQERSFFIHSRIVGLVLGLILLRLVFLDIFLEVTFPDQKLNFILQFGALLSGVPNIFVIGAVLVFVCVWPMSYRVKAMHKRFISYGVHDMLIADRQGGVVVVFLVNMLLLRSL